MLRDETSKRDKPCGYGGRAAQARTKFPRRNTSGPSQELGDSVE